MANIGYLALNVDIKSFDLPTASNTCIYNGKYFTSLESLAKQLSTNPPNIIYPACLMIFKVEGLTRMVDKYQRGDESCLTVLGLIKIDNKDDSIQELYF